MALTRTITPLFNQDTSFPAEHIDAFSRLRVSAPGYRFDSQLTYRIDSDLWDVAETGDGDVSHDATNRQAILTAGATAGANTAILQSHYHAPYTPGRGQLVFVTFAMPGTVPENGERGAGYYDGSNGVFLKETAAGLTLNLATTTDASDAPVAQADWNIDPLDGTGPSGITLDVTKTNILAIQIQALYVGRVVVGFDIEGSLVPVHAFNHANLVADPDIAQASLPIRYWASTATDAADCVIHAVCSSVISEGGDNLENMSGRQFVASGTLTDANPKIAVVVIRAKEQLNSIDQNALIVPIEVSVVVQTVGCWIEVWRNATVTAGTFTDVDSASVIEASFAGNAGTDPAVTADTGTLVDKFYLPASAQVRTSERSGLLGKALLAYSHLLGAGDNLTVVADGGNTTEVFVAVKWKEIR
jgi:hypothetical protein